MKFVLLILFTSTLLAVEKTKSIHIYVALCDNKHQGIVPVPKSLGDGNKPHSNLYWGAMYGTKTFLKKSSHWTLLQTTKNPRTNVLEQCIFKHTKSNTFIIADAYQGSKIKDCTTDFLNASSANKPKAKVIGYQNKDYLLQYSGNADLVVYVGHNGLMDFKLGDIKNQRKKSRQSMILCCKGSQYFSSKMRKMDNELILTTTNFMAPEAYILEASFESWIKGQSKNAVALSAAKAYQKYQKCSLAAAKRLFSVK